MGSGCESKKKQQEAACMVCQEQVDEQVLTLPAPVTADGEHAPENLRGIAATKHPSPALCRHTAMPVAWGWGRAKGLKLIPFPGGDVQNICVIHEAPC